MIGCEAILLSFLTSKDAWLESPATVGLRRHFDFSVQAQEDSQICKWSMFRQGTLCWDQRYPILTTLSSLCHRKTYPLNCLSGGNGFSELCYHCLRFCWSQRRCSPLKVLPKKKTELRRCTADAQVSGCQERFQISEGTTMNHEIIPRPILTSLYSY